MNDRSTRVKAGCVGRVELRGRSLQIIVAIEVFQVCSALLGAGIYSLPPGFLKDLFGGIETMSNSRFQYLLMGSAIAFLVRYRAIAQEDSGCFWVNPTTGKNG
jgi:hypothetical protein